MNSRERINKTAVLLKAPVDKAEGPHFPLTVVPSTVDMMEVFIHFFSCIEDLMYTNNVK